MIAHGTGKVPQARCMELSQTSPGDHASDAADRWL